MRTLKTSRWLALLTVLTAAACDAFGTTAPVEEVLTLEDEIALQTLENPVAIQTALELAGMNASSSPWRGIWPGTQSTESAYGQQARAHFANAVEALQVGDRMRAAHESRQARELISQGIAAMRGPQGITAMVERMEGVSLTATTMGANHQDSEQLSHQMQMLSGWARESMGRGDLTRAGALGVLGEQRFSQCVAGGMGWGMGGTLGTGTGNTWGWGMGSGWGMGNGHGMGNGTGWGHGMGHGNGNGTTHSGVGYDAGLVVSLGNAAVALATQILTDAGADTEQESYLSAAVEAQALAEEALLAGEVARAAYQADLAQWQALKSLVLPGGVTAEEAQAMLALAQTLYADAEAAVGTSPTDVQAELLARAAAMIQMGESHMSSFGYTGVNPLWRAAVISFFLIG